MKYLYKAIAISIILTASFTKHASAAYNNPIDQDQLKTGIISPNYVLDSSSGRTSPDSTTSNYISDSGESSVIGSPVPSFNMQEYFETVLENRNSNYTERITHKASGGNKYNNPAITIDVMHETVKEAYKLYQERLANGSWVDNQQPLPELNNAYIQKKILPTGSEIIFFGDLHGSIHALIRSLQELQKTGHLDEYLRVKKNCYLVFLGDLVDYGDYGIDTSFTAFQLLLRNPNNVFLCRGNHEEDLQFNQPNKPDTLFVEINKRYKNANSEERTEFQADIRKLFFQLPQALFLGIKGSSDNKYAQCCHGGFQEGAEETLQKLFQDNRDYAGLDSSTVERKSFPGYPEFNLISTNFNWGDISGLKETNLSNRNRYSRSGGRPSLYIKKHSIDEAQSIMERTNVSVLFRGHADGCHCFKATLPDIDYPIYPLLEKRTGMTKQYYSDAELNILDSLKPGIQEVMTNVNTLYTTGFPIKNFRQVSPAIIFTHSNALTSKVFHDHGFSIVKTGTSWDESNIRVYINETDDNSNMLKDPQSRVLFDQSCR